MAAGNTSTIDRDIFSAEWRDYVPISDLCIRFTVTKDQILRLRDLWSLERRMDCTRRAKPPRAPRPSAGDREASLETLDLSPAVAAAAARERAAWDEETRRRRDGERHAGEQARVERRRYRFVARLPDDGGSSRQAGHVDDVGAMTWDADE